MQLNKRASLEISMQSIVIVVLALIILGLGLVLIRGLFKNNQNDIDEVTLQKISFPNTEIYVDKGTSTLLTIGIMNTQDKDLNYRMKFIAVSDPNGNLFGNPDALGIWFKYSQPTGPQGYVLRPGENDVRDIRLEMPTALGILAGTYSFRFEVTDLEAFGIDAIYAQKDFFVIVR